MQENPYVDRALRALFVACAVGLAWGIRGDFGGTTGAMYPGVMLALAFAYVSGQESVARRMPVLAILGGLFIGMGGMMSYGVLHGYAKADTPINYSYGFFTLLLQGGCWGLFGGGAIGLALDDRRPGLAEGIGLAVAVVLVGVGVEKFVGDVLEWHVDSRGNSIIPFIGGGVVFITWQAVRGFDYGLRGAFFGFQAFGIGMSFGRLLGNASYHLPVDINTWNIMEISCGFIGGLIYTWGMVGLPDRGEDPPEGASPWALLGILYVALGVPLLHLAAVGDPAKARAAWAETLSGLGHTDAASLAAQIHTGLAVVVFSGAILAGLWYWWHNGEHLQWAWIPALGLSIIMLLFENLNALFYWQPSKDNYFDTTNISWLLLAAMVIYIAVRRQHETIDSDDEDTWWPVAARWAAGLVCIFLLTLAVAAKTNGELTMQSAEMRFPEWSHRDGPPPPR